MIAMESDPFPSSRQPSARSGSGLRPSAQAAVHRRRVKNPNRKQMDQYFQLGKQAYAEGWDDQQRKAAAQRLIATWTGMEERSRKARLSEAMLVMDPRLGPYLDAIKEVSEEDYRKQRMADESFRMKTYQRLQHIFLENCRFALGFLAGIPSALVSMRKKLNAA